MLATMVRLRFLLLLLAVPGVPCQQPADEAVARYRLAGKEAVVTRDDLALELAERYARTERGREARRHLLEVELVRDAARAAELWPTREAVAARRTDLERELRTQGIALPEFLARRGMKPAEFDEYLALSLAHEALARKALGLGPADPVQREVLQLWTKEEAERRKVVEDEATLPEGVVALLGTRSFTMLDLGRVLLRTLAKDDRERFIRQVALRRCIAAEAKAQGIEVSEADLQAEIEVRRKDSQRNPRMAGVPFEQLLAAQGTSVAGLLRSPVFKAQVQEARLAARLYPDAEVQRMLREERAALLERHGPRRLLQVILVRALETPNAIVRRDFAAAREHALHLRETIAKDRPFDLVARAQSEDPYTKAQAGDAGWHGRTGPTTLPREVRDAGFGLDLNQVSEPVRSADGYWLVRLAGVEEPPSDTVLEERLRRELAERARDKLLAAAQIEFVGS